LGHDLVVVKKTGQQVWEKDNGFPLPRAEKESPWRRKRNNRFTIKQGKDAK